MTKLLRIGKQIRLWAERVAEREGFDYNLTGLCARSSGQLYNLLRENGYDPVIFSSRNGYHFYVVVDGYIMDVTATQFEETEDIDVLVVPVDEVRHLRQYTPGRVFLTPQAVAKYQRRKQWSNDQIVQEESIHG